MTTTDPMLTTPEALVEHLDRLPMVTAEMMAQLVAGAVAMAADDPNAVQGLALIRLLHRSLLHREAECVSLSAAYANLTRVQERCTKQEAEIRDLKARIGEARFVFASWSDGPHRSQAAEQLARLGSILGCDR